MLTTLPLTVYCNPVVYYDFAPTHFRAQIQLYCRANDYYLLLRGLSLRPIRNNRAVPQDIDNVLQN